MIMRKYLINGEEVTERIFNDSLETNLTDQFTEDDFEELVSDSYPETVICGITFSAGRILRLCDQVAFRCGYSDEISNRLYDLQYDLQNDLYNYGGVEVNGYTYEVVESDDEE